MAEIGNVTVRVDSVITDEQYHEAISAVSAANEYIAALEAENAKLRELVLEAHSCKTNEGCCDDCYCDEGCCPIERRMQDLGIEVQE